MTICTRCGEERGDDFHPNNKKCRICTNELARESRKKLKDKPRPDTITCKKCGEETKDFRTNRKVCIPCEREHGREYRRTTDKAKIWAANNRERMSELQHEWYEKNKKDIGKNQRARIKNDPVLSLVTKHRASLSLMVGGKLKKTKYCELSGNDFRHWICFQHKRGMNLENYNDEWVLDHVIPVHALQQGIVEQDAVLHWLNVRPLSKVENLRRNKYADQEDCLQHLKIAEVYVEMQNLDKSKYEPYLSALQSFAKHLVAGTTLQSFGTTSDEKSSEGSRLIAEPDGKNPEELVNPPTRT